ncbi:MauE/DoxX family redox-associated membrane protein [Halodesulfovibrio marinisediminis]|uniref:Methylamine utilisation protein MauE n=1 Tax=Halodesulfovibrio marinisediminis DSM 17456 TaxID=1121457 RepID=A0A1N6H9V4_9BACT|nr:MauE/DoxX family redox-associated membrane protein [Halodesulfovibrio marinisediminis]SIO16608.1 Methylamine utilisation protein MauE [Halodesulfovibrio marinisediminis DSM 17456]
MSVLDNISSRIFQRTTVVLVVRLLLGAVFAYAGAAKLWDIRGFGIIIEEFGVVPLWLLPYVAFGLPFFEVLAGLGLILNVRGSLPAITAMTLAFLAVLGYAMHEGLVIADCGCFAAGEVPSGYDDGSALREAFIRDVGLLAACCFLFVSSMRRNQTARVL